MGPEELLDQRLAYEAFNTAANIFSLLSRDQR